MAVLDGVAGVEVGDVDITLGIGALAVRSVEAREGSGSRAAGIVIDVDVVGRIIADIEEALLLLFVGKDEEGPPLYRR